MARTLPGCSVAAVALATALAPAQALAQGSPPPPLPNDPAIYQYREDVPTGAGPAAPGPGTARVARLPAPVQAVLEAEGGPDAALLEEVATSSEYGAPQVAAVRPPDAEARPRAPSELPPTSVARSAEAAAGAVTDAPAHLVVALTLILGLTAAFGLAVRRDARTSA